MIVSEMLKREIINRIVEKYSFTRYLEIGVLRGHCFLLVKCRYKTAVDPQFLISKYFALKQAIKYPWNILNKYHEIPSSTFFELIKDQTQYDIVCVDGLHTFRQSLEDIVNSLNHLSSNGFVVVHDCFPPHQAASTPAPSIEVARKMNIPGWDDLWCGDVWKSIVYLIQNYSSTLDIKTVDTDFGVGLISFKTKKSFELSINIDLSSIDKLTFEDLERDPGMINLIPLDKLEL